MSFPLTAAAILRKRLVFLGYEIESDRLEVPVFSSVIHQMDQRMNANVRVYWEVTVTSDFLVGIVPLSSSTLETEVAHRLAFGSGKWWSKSKSMDSTISAGKSMETYGIVVDAFAGKLAIVTPDGKEHWGLGTDNWDEEECKAQRRMLQDCWTPFFALRGILYIAKLSD